MPTKLPRILVVDDQPAIRYTVAKILQRARYDVQEASTGAEALRLTAEKPNLVILDVGLPDLSGYDVCRKIKSNPATASIPVLHLSATFAETENRVRGLEGGADGYLTYPIEPQELLANVQALLRMREAERQMREQRELLRVTLSSIGDGVIATDAAGRVAFMNPSAQALCGWTESEAAGRALEDVFEVSDAEAGSAAGNGNGHSGHAGLSAPLPVCTVLIARDGTRRAIDHTTTPIRDDQGACIGRVLVFRDVTQRQQALRELWESEERLRLAIAVSEMGTWDHDVAADRVTWSPRTEELFGLKPGTFEGSSTAFYERVHPEDREALRAVVPCHVTGEADYRVEYRIVWPDGSVHWMSGRGKQLCDLSGRVVRTIGVVVDITERKRFEQMLRQRAEELAAESRRKDEFLAMLAHELRNPLAPLRGVVDVLRSREVDGPALQRSYALIDRQVEHLTRLVDDLLDVARLARGKIELRHERLELSQLVEQAIETARPILKAREHRLTVSLPPEPLRLDGDSTRLVQIFSNLLHNAAKFTEPQGVLTVNAERDSEQVVVRFRDNGIGMSADLVPQVFDLFAQGQRSSDRSHGGLGLGLSLVRRLVEMHGGTVTAHSDGPGKGSEFVIRLPLSPAGAAERREPPRAEADVAKFVPVDRVLVVDDNHDVAESFAMMLDGLARDVRVAHSGGEALEMAGAFRPDVIFCDISMPRMDGHEFAETLRRKPESAGVLLAAVSGYGQEGDLQRSAEAGFDYHLVKPISRARLKEILGAVEKPGGNANAG